MIDDEKNGGERREVSTDPVSGYEALALAPWGRHKRLSKTLIILCLSPHLTNILPRNIGISQSSNLMLLLMPLGKTQAGASNGCSLMFLT